MTFFGLYRNKRFKNLHGTNGTSKEFTLDTTEGNLNKKEKSRIVDSLLDPNLVVMDVDTFILNLKTDEC